jgi:hypothetical protein
MPQISKNVLAQPLAQEKALAQNGSALTGDCT